ncbi:MAG: acyl dehydratase, partial [Solirubrobacteraceae bacterium]
MSSVEGVPVLVGGPWFEEIKSGAVFEDAPGLTLTSGHAALHQALVGDRLRLALDAALCREVTGHDRPLAHPNLVCDVSIGQSTGPSQRVRGNLFYRGLVLARPVFIGETLRTRTEIVGLKQNRRRAGSPSTGL